VEGGEGALKGAWALLSSRENKTTGGRDIFCQTASPHALPPRPLPPRLSPQICGVQVLLASTAAAIYARAQGAAPALAALGLAAGEGAIFCVAAAALARRSCGQRRRRPGGGASSPSSSAPPPPLTAGTGMGRPVGMATSESTVALTALCGPGDSAAHAGGGGGGGHPAHQAAGPEAAGDGCRAASTPSKGGAAALVVQPSGGSFALALVADGAAGEREWGERERERGAPENARALFPQPSLSHHSHSLSKKKKTTQPAPWTPPPPLPARPAAPPARGCRPGGAEEEEAKGCEEIF